MSAQAIVAIFAAVAVAVIRPCHSFPQSRLGMSTFVAECIDANDEAKYEFQWHQSWTAVRKNKHGTTGWATLLKSSSSKRPAGTVCRVHLCGDNPCGAKWPASKYGFCMVPPLHLQLVEVASKHGLWVASKPPPPPLVEPPPAPVVPSAVAEPSGPSLPAPVEPSAVAVLAPPPLSPLVEPPPAAIIPEEMVAPPPLPPPVEPPPASPPATALQSLKPAALASPNYRCER